MKLSVVTTLYRSAPYVQEFYARAHEAALAVTTDFEIIFVNDGSPDDSLERAVALHERDARVRVIDLSRNFGHHKAMMTGLMHASGDLIFLIDSDLEEAPEWVGRFIEVAKSAQADVVYGVQEHRKGALFERFSGLLFYRLFNLMLEHPLPENVVTARLMTRRYVNALVQHRDREVCLAGLWVITGFRQVPLPVDKGNRHATSYSPGHRLAVLVNSITSFSNRPLIYIFYLGCLIMLSALVAGGYMIGRAFARGIGVPGWASLIVSVWFLGGVTIFCLGVIGIYLSKVFMETKDRPYTIVRADHHRRPEAHS
jgi:putative glycosyltransferase